MGENVPRKWGFVINFPFVVCVSNGGFYWNIDWISVKTPT